MHPERWAAIKEVVQGALDRPAAERDQWMACVCASDSLLLEEARTLVRAASVTFGFLESGVTFPAQHHAPAPSTNRHSGRVVSHYQLHERIGAGAMGEVYRASDLALGRPAALKLLPSAFDSTLRLRLLSEAEASAKLQHPAIATFYDAGEADGETFIAMELVEGRTLRSLLEHGPIPTDNALAIACCLLEALAHAHAAALLHRDIKPENIMVVGARSAKLLDFSIAMPIIVAVSAVSVDAVTVPEAPASDGPLVGTVGYLAPEQVAGLNLDARTDIFQVGTVLYEMLTGRPAFPGTTTLDRLAALLMHDPDLDRLSEVQVSDGITAMLRCALQRDPAKRYPDAAAFLRDVRRLGHREVPTPFPRIVAVFDFTVLGSRDPVEWLGSAFGESVRVALAGVAAVRLVPRDRAARELTRLAQETGGADPLVASLRLGCQSMVRGQVEVMGQTLRARADVVDVATGDSVAIEQVGGALKDLATVQARLTTALCHALSEATGISRPTHGDRTFEAQECYTRARLQIERFGKGSLEDAVLLLERAIAIDGGDADALAALATALALRAIATTDPADYEAAVAAADRALAVDPDRVKAHVWKGYALAAQDRIEQATLAFGRAIELDPFDTEALYFAAGAHLMTPARMSPEKALTLLQRAVDIDDARGIWWLALGTAHQCLDQSREAIYSFTRAQKLEATPGRFATAGAAAYVGEALRRSARLGEAWDRALAGVEAAERSDHAYRDTFRAYGLTVLGRVAIDRRDTSAAEAAFSQVLAQARGRPRTRACGHLVVQALCGLARAGMSTAVLDEARTLFARQDTYNFGFFYGALKSDTLFELALAAHTLGRTGEANALHAHARAAGDRRALEELGTTSAPARPAGGSAG
jgi:tetratricopeptide (TPR) repeat protein/TolB-like protein